MSTDVLLEQESSATSNEPEGSEEEDDDQQQDSAKGVTEGGGSMSPVPQKRKRPHRKYKKAPGAPKRFRSGRV